MPISDLALLLRSLTPQLNEGIYVFATLAENQRVATQDLIALVREPQGISVVVEERKALALGLNATFRCAWITLNVNSDLAAVGLTAAFAAVLGKANISCNVVAGANHDHIFVPVAQAEEAMDVLRDLQSRALAENGR
jgi:hypothetical protein